MADDFSFRQHNDFIRNVQNALLMADDEDGAVAAHLPHPLKDADEVLEAPQVDARFRLVKHGQLRAAREHRCNLNALEFAAGQAAVYLTVYIIPRAKPHFGQNRARFADRQALARRNPQQIQHGDALEAHGLLEGVADAEFGAVGDRQVGHVRAVEQNFACRRLLDAGNHLRQRRFSAAVRPGDDHKTPAVHRQRNIMEDFLSRRLIRDGKGQMLDV